MWRSRMMTQKKLRRSKKDRNRQVNGSQSQSKRTLQIGYSSMTAINLILTEMMQIYTLNQVNYLWMVKPTNLCFLRTKACKKLSKIFFLLFQVHPKLKTQHLFLRGRDSPRDKIRIKILVFYHR